MITAWRLLCYCRGHLRVLPRASTCTASGIYVYCLGHLRVLPRASTCTASGIYVYCLGHLRVLPRASTCTASGIYVYCLWHPLAACVLSGSKSNPQERHSIPISSMDQSLHVNSSVDVSSHSQISNSLAFRHVATSS